MMRGGTAAEVAEMAGRAVDGGLISEQSGDSGLVMDAGFALGAAGDFSRAGRAWSDALADVRRRGSVIGFARCSCMRAILRLHQGALGEAESDARNSIEAGWEPGYRIARMAYGPLTESLVEQGELTAADGSLSAAGFAAGIADTYMLNFVLFSRGRLRLAQGRHDEAIADLDELGRRERKWRGRNPAVFPYRSFLALALAASGEHDRAQALAAEEVALARGWGAAGPLGRALRALALVTGGDGGLELLGQSRAVLDGSGWRLEHARTVIELGAATRRAGRRAGARDLLRPGMELAHACGARALVARAREELLATGARPRRIVRTGADALTASERRVARMAAEGMTNREIAQALFVTMRTVEVHLTHAYQKLGVSSREKLPAALG
jgi:DNA-binding CsgD family transcriptional regulator